MDLPFQPPLFPYGVSSQRRAANTEVAIALQQRKLRMTSTLIALYIPAIWRYHVITLGLPSVDGPDTVGVVHEVQVGAAERLA